MASTKIIVPDYQFSGFYYADLLRRLRIFDRVEAPEITSETPEEPFIQAERAFSLVGHYSNVLLDVAAQEAYLPTANLQDSVRLLLRLIDYDIADYSPATVELLIKLAQIPTASVELHEAAALFETERTEETEPIPFELLEQRFIGPCDVIDAAFGLEKDREGSDGNTLFGEPTWFESALMAVAAGDLLKELEISGSILGNNGVFKIAEIINIGAISQIRLGATLGGREPLFIPEAGLTWKIRTYTADGSTALNTTGVPDFQPWVDPEAGDKLYLGGIYSLWDVLDLTFATPGANISGVWEYYDPDEIDEEPDDVTNLGATLRLDLTTLLGTVDRRGAFVRATYLPTGISELLVSEYVGGANVVETSAFLGQSGTPSLDPGDYAVGTDWNPLPDQVDGTSDLSADGQVEYTFPQSPTRNWTSLEVEGTEAYYLRYRVISVAAPTAPVLDRARIDQGGQYVLETATQGRTVDTEPLVSSNGRPKQAFVLSRKPGLRATVRGWVDEGGGEVEWENRTAVGERLVSSGPTDRHFIVDQDSLGTLTVRFGDGTNGKIPPLGVDNIRFTYRVDATQDGNVGSDTVVVNSDGVGLAAEVTNPRPASGWREAEGASEESLALVKETGPASLRAGENACSPGDYETHAVAFVDSRGSRPVVRAKAIEEGYGPKTIRLVVVGTNGLAISTDDKEELEAYFNGDPITGEGGIGQANVQVYVDNFNPRLIGPTILIEANSALTVDAVTTRLATFLNPTARESDGSGGLKYVWRFGGRVPLSRIASEIFAISPGNVFDVDVLSPTVDYELLEDELPFLYTPTLGISIVAPTT